MDDHAIDLWARFLDQDLSSPEKAEIELSLCGDESLRESVVDDLELDGVLRRIGQIDATADDFVAQVAAKLPADAIDTVIPPPRIYDSNGKNAIANIQPPPVVPVSRTNENTGTNETNRSSVSRTNNWQTLALCAASLAVLLLVGTIAVVATSTNQHVADDRANDKQVESVETKESVPDPYDVDSEATTKSIEATPSANPPRENNSTETVEQPEIVPVPVRPAPSTIVERPSSDQPSNQRQDSQIVIARLVGSIGAVWESKPQSELNDAPLRLLEGTAQLVMRNGTTVNLRGPSDFQFVSPKNVVLTRGKLSAAVPQQAIGFMVNTPSSRIVDLGTEFDVSVDNNGTTAVRVRRGEVQFGTLPKDGSESEQWNLTKGQFKMLAKDGTAHDWNVVMTFDVSGNGVVTINGDELTIKSTDDFILAQHRVMEEFAAFERDFVSRTNGRPRKSFRGSVSINDRSMKFETPTQFRTVRRITGQQLDRLEKLFRSLDSDGTVEINGKRWSFNSREDFEKAQKEFNESMRNFFNSMGLPVPN